MSTENNTEVGRPRKWYFDVELARVMRDNGWTWKALADEFEVPASTMRYALDERYREQIVASAKRWGKANPEKRHAAYEAWRQRPEVKERIRASQKRYRQRQRERLAYLERVAAEAGR